MESAEQWQTGEDHGEGSGRGGPCKPTHPAHEFEAGVSMLQSGFRILHGPLLSSDACCGTTLWERCRVGIDAFIPDYITTLARGDASVMAVGLDAAGDN